MDIVGYGTKGTGKGLLPDLGLSADLWNNRGTLTPGDVSGKREQWDFKAAAAAVAEQLRK